MTRWLSGLCGLVLASVVSAPAWAQGAPTHAGCELSSDLRACAGGPACLTHTWALLPAGVVFVVARPEDNAISLLVPDGDQYREIGLYWPTPQDPQYAYRRMSRLPYSSTLLGNDFDQSLIVLREPTEFVVDGQTRQYRPINYGGYTLNIDGCGGDDQLYGGNGNDHLFDYSGNNELRGYGGRDWLEGVGGYFGGGDGDDCIQADGGAGFTQLFGDAGNDALLSVGPNGAARGGEGDDSCIGSSTAGCESATPAVCLGWN
ncbi:MAG: hypothetical protein QM756_39540 [Polyangiaceae bacterium]